MMSLSYKEITSDDSDQSELVAMTGVWNMQYVKLDTSSHWNVLSASSLLTLLSKQKQLCILDDGCSRSPRGKKAEA